MKSKAILILIALVFSILSSFVVRMPISVAGESTYWAALDVCSASGSFVTNDTNMCLHESVFTPVGVNFQEDLDLNGLLYAPVVYSNQLERPPSS